MQLTKAQVLRRRLYWDLFSGSWQEAFGRCTIGTTRDEQESFMTCLRKGRLALLWKKSRLFFQPSFICSSERIRQLQWTLSKKSCDGRERICLKSVSFLPTFNSSGKSRGCGTSPFVLAIFWFKGPKTVSLKMSQHNSPMAPTSIFWKCKQFGVGPLIIKGAYHLFIHQPT